MQFGSVTLAKGHFSPAWTAGFEAWGSVTRITTPNPALTALPDESGAGSGSA